MKFILSSLLLLAGSITSFPVWSACENTGVQLQVLGSGGPGHSAGRASAAYLLWIDGVGRIMVDAGGGTKDRFHESGANLGDIELIALSHLHPDHAAELPAILWPSGGSFRLSGPTGSGAFPTIGTFLEKLFGPDGAFAVLADRIDLDVTTVDVSTGRAADVWREEGLLVRGKRVPHGNVPTIGYRVEMGNTSIGFTSDQNGSDPSFIDFIRGVDVLVIHMAVGEDAAGAMAELHARPSVWGQMATAAGADHVVVSHISTPSPQALETNLEILRSNYGGEITVAEDLMCISLD